MLCMQSKQSMQNTPYIPAEIWGLILSNLDLDEKAVASTVCKTWRDELSDSLYSTRPMILHEIGMPSMPSIPASNSNANNFAQYIADQVKAQEVEPWLLYERRISAGGPLSNLDLIITKLRGHILLPYIYSVVFIKENPERFAEYTLIQIYFDTEQSRFQHIKLARNSEHHIDIPMMLFYMAYRILSTLYKDDEKEPMDIFSYSSNRFSKSCVFLENIPRWFDKLMSFQSRYHGKILKKIMCESIKV